MIPRKLKECSVCHDPCLLWVSKPPMCKDCAMKAKVHAKPHKPLVQTISGEVAKPTRIAPISKNRAEALKKYRRLRDKHFKEHPVCEFPGCNSTKITLHHMRGRVGAFLTDKRYFKSLCIPHHRFVEQNPVEAKKLGLSDSRLSKIV